jgi:hypothetical protein
MHIFKNCIWWDRKMQGEKKVQKEKEDSLIVYVYMLIEHALLPLSISIKRVHFLVNKTTVWF